MPAMVGLDWSQYIRDCHLSQSSNNARQPNIPKPPSPFDLTTWWSWPFIILVGVCRYWKHFFFRVIRIGKQSLVEDPTLIWHFKITIWSYEKKRPCMNKSSYTVAFSHTLIFFILGPIFEAKRLISIIECFWPEVKHCK